MSNLPEMKAPAGYIYRREKRDFGEYYDREELITCEDCKYFIEDIIFHKPMCARIGHAIVNLNADDFCSRAEKRDSYG